MSIRRGRRARRRYQFEGMAPALEPRALLTYSPVAEVLRVNEAVEGAQIKPFFGTAADGSTLVVWMDGDLNSFNNLHGRWIDARSQPIGEQFLINEETTGTRELKMLDVDPDGNMMAAWEESSRWRWEPSRLYLQRFDAEGAKRGEPLLLSEDEGRSGDRATLIRALPDGGLVVLTANHLDKSLRYRRFDSEGALQASVDLDDPVDEGWTSNKFAWGQLVGDSLILTWDEERTREVGPGELRYDSRAWARRLDLDGRPIGDDILITSLADATKSSQAEPRYASLTPTADGGFLATWSEFVATDGLPLVTRRGRIHGADGAATGPDFEINRLAPMNEFVQTAPLSNGNFVTFVSEFLPSRARAYRFQLLSPAGAPITDWIPTELPDDYRIFAGVRETADGGFMVAWDDSTGLAGTGDVYVRMYADDGSGEPGGNEEIAAVDPSLYLDKGENGLWAWSEADGEVRLSPWTTEGATVGRDGRVYIDFGQRGLWTWTTGDAELTLVNAADPEALLVGPDGAVYIDYGQFGLWRMEAGAFAQLNGANPEGFAATPDGVLFVDFGPYGLWRRGTGDDFAQLNAANPEGLVATPDGALFVDFGPFGFWRQGASGIALVNGADPQAMAAHSDGSVFVDFGPFGLWRWNNGFQKLNDADPSSLLGGPDGTMYVDFNPYGLWAWTAEAGIARIHEESPRGMAIGRDGLLHIVFGPDDVHRRETSGEFTPLIVAGVRRLFA